MEVEEGEQRTEQTHDILPYRAIPQLLPFRFEQFPGNSPALVLVIPEILQSWMTTVIKQPCDQPREPFRDRHKEEE